MVPVTPITPPGNLPKASKAKNGRKKKYSSSKTNGYSTNNNSEIKLSPSTDNDDESQKDEKDEETKEAHEAQELLGTIDIHTESNYLPYPEHSTVILSKTQSSGTSLVNKTDANMTLEAMSHQRESLLAEVEQFRKTLENIQDRHVSDLNNMKRQHVDEVSKIEAKHSEVISAIHKKHAEEIATLKIELEASTGAKDAAEIQYQNLLERVNTIKSSLGERFKADRQELADAKIEIEELEAQRDAYEERVKELEIKLERLDLEHQESLSEVSSLRNQYDISQHNLSLLSEDLVTQTRQLKEEIAAAKEATGGWEMLAIEERSCREVLVERIKDLEEQISSHKEALKLAVLERDSNLENLEALQQNFQNFQHNHKTELQEMVESYQNQIQDLEKLVQKADCRASEVESSRSLLQAELERLMPIEKELKEKNLLIGKLRHEAIVLNDHLTKALRFLKKAKPEDNIDRQIVTNHFLHFLALDRSDPKKFQILQLIASLLNWTDEQKEQAGLARPGTSNLLQRLPATNFHRTPSTPSLSMDFFNDASTKRESLADLWRGFLERSAEEGELNNRNGSLSLLSLSKTEGEI